MKNINCGLSHFLIVYRYFTGERVELKKLFNTLSDNIYMKQKLFLRKQDYSVKCYEYTQEFFGYN